MRLALIADTFPPLRTSGAVQLRDLSREFVRQGHKLTVILPASDIDESWQLQEIDGLEILRLKAPRTKDIDYVRRTVGEFVMPWAMRRHLKKSPFATTKWDGVIWYSPSIFFGPLVSWLKKANGCKSYLIIRDIFPEWAVDMGLMGRGLLIRDERVGQVCETNQLDELLQITVQLLNQIEADQTLSANCKALFKRDFAVEKTVKQIVAAIMRKSK